jgi:hypothetical protein
MEYLKQERDGMELRVPELSNDTPLVKLKLLVRVNAISGERYECGFFR